MTKEEAWNKAFDMALATLEDNEKEHQEGIMTKEEALKILDTIPTIGEQVDALEMAIKALKEYPDKIILHNDKVIIEPTLYMKPQVFHDNAEFILKQMGTEDVIVLPQGFTAKIVRRDVVFGDTKGEADDN